MLLKTSRAGKRPTALFLDIHGPTYTAAGASTGSLARRRMVGRIVHDNGAPAQRVLRTHRK